MWNRNFLLVFTVNICNSVSFQMMNATLSKYVLFRGMSIGIMGVVSSAFVITSLAIRPFSGGLCDRKKKNLILAVSLACIAIAIIGCSISSSIYLLAASRLLHGLGWGMSTTAASTIATMSLSESNMGQGIGIFALAQVLSTAIAPNIGLWLINAAGYPVMFAIAAAMPIIGIGLSFLLNGHAIDTNQRIETSNRKIWDAVFAKECLLPTFLILMTTVATSTVSGFLAIYAEEKGVPGIGIFFTVYACALFVTRPLCGQLSDKIKRAYIIIPAFAILAATYVIFVFAGNLCAFLAAAITYGLGYGALQPVLQAWSVKAVGKERRGVANSTFFMGLDLGTSAGMLAASQVAEHWGYAAMYACMVSPLAIGAVVFCLSLLRKK